MQNPMTPTAPVQRSWPTSQLRAAEMSWKARPRPLRSEVNVDRMQRMAPPWLNRSGAIAR